MMKVMFYGKISEDLRYPGGILKTIFFFSFENIISAAEIVRNRMISPGVQTDVLLFGDQH